MITPEDIVDHSDHLDERTELEQERDYYKEKYENLLKETEEMRKAIEQLHQDILVRKMKEQDDKLNYDTGGK